MNILVLDCESVDFLAAGSAFPVMHLLFLHGPPAAGKLTLARILADRFGFALFHNHLTVDLLLSVFPFGSPAFVRNRELIWLEVIHGALDEHRPLIFTFNPERTVSTEFPEKLRDVAVSTGSQFHSIHVACDWAKVEGRIDLDERKRFKKLSSLQELRRLRELGAFDYPTIHSDFTIDTSDISIDQAGDRIVRFLAPRIGESNAVS